MDKYVYLLLALALFVPLMIIIIIRQDLAKKTIKLGTLGGFVGLFSEFFYFRDYWQPPSLMGKKTVSIEDFIFGFSITGLSFAVYLWGQKAENRKIDYEERKKIYVLFFILGVAAMAFFNLKLRINSILVSSAVFLILAGVILFLRPDLVKVGLYSAGMITCFILMIYLMLFDVISRNFWDSYWLLAGTRWGITLLGNVPLSELLWYFSWALFASISYPFASGRSVLPQMNKNMSREK